MRWLAGIAVLLIASGAGAVELPRPPGAELTHEAITEQGSYPLPVAAFGGDRMPTVRISGAVSRRAYSMSAEGRSITSVMAGYRDALAAEGLRRLLDCEVETCGGFDFRFGAELVPPPAMRMDVRRFAQISAGREGPAAYASILASQVRDRIHVQVVTVVPADPGMPLAGVPLDARLPVPEQREHELVEDADAASPAPAEEEESAASPTPEGADQGATRDAPAEDGRAAAEAREDGTLLDRLLADGHVPLPGLAFASAGAALEDGSGRILDEVAAMLAAAPDLGVVVVGHSDNVGSLDANIDLSRRRAEAVREALIARGVAAGRLEARGIGFLAPRRSNATEEGRTLNRRVELVLR